MPPTDKAKAAGVSASSFLDLKAELTKHEQELTKSKAAGRATTVVGGIKRPDKKPTKWMKPNVGVHARAARDIELEEISRPTLESARAVLERKAKVYEKLAKGKSGGLSEKQFSQLLVDFEQKGVDDYESDSDEVDESLTVPAAPREEEDDPIMEYEDEFGRVRTARKSEIPRHLLPQTENEREEDFDPYVVYNPVNHFPVYEPSSERVEAIRAEFAEENNPLNIHYDASHEVRAKGAGFYQFSGDEETRRQQMDELLKTREETERLRRELGAADVRPGEVEGMYGEAASVGVPIKSRGAEKRKRELEERRKLLEAKRRKIGGHGGEAARASPGPTSTSSPPLLPPTQPAPLADPFAALEAQATQKKASAPQIERPTQQNAADAFLAQLEQDILKGKGR